MTRHHPLRAAVVLSLLAYAGAVAALLLPRRRHS